MKRTIIGLFFLNLFLINTFLISMVHASFTTRIYYDGHWGLALFYPLNEIMTFDVPAKNLATPGQYPYAFSLNETLHAYLQIRHFLWAYNEKYSNHLAIWIDNESVLEASSPRETCPNGWYPGGNGVQVIDLGMRSAGTHFMTMTCNISDYYTVDWWKILLISPTVPRMGAHTI